MAMQGVKWGQGLSDGEEGNVLEMESGEMVSNPGFVTSEHLRMEQTSQEFHEVAFVFMGSVK